MFMCACTFSDSSARCPLIVFQPDLLQCNQVLSEFAPPFKNGSVCPLHTETPRGAYWYSDVTILGWRQLRSSFIREWMLDRKHIFEWLNGACCTKCFECSPRKSLYKFILWPNILIEPTLFTESVCGLGDLRTASFNWCASVAFITSSPSVCSGAAECEAVNIPGSYCRSNPLIYLPLPHMSAVIRFLGSCWYSIKREQLPDVIEVPLSARGLTMRTLGGSGSMQQKQDEQKEYFPFEGKFLCHML